MPRSNPPVPASLVPVKQKYPQRPPATEPEWVHLDWIQTTCAQFGKWPAILKRIRSLPPALSNDLMAAHDRKCLSRLQEEIVPLFDKIKAHFPPEMCGKFRFIQSAYDAARRPNKAASEWRMARNYASVTLAKLNDRADRPPLGENARLLYEYLIYLPEHEAMTGPKILDWFMQKHSKNVDQGTLTKEIIPALKPYGIENTPRIGYQIPISHRPKKSS
jgi:hypothetical protein